MIEELYKEGMGYSYFNRMKEAEEEANKFKENYKRLEQENKNLRKVMWDNKCPHYVLGECSHGHHENCYGMAKCIEDLEQECDELQKQCVKYAQINEQETKDYAELLHENENQKKTIAELLEACNKCDEYNEAKYQLNILENTLKNIRCLLSDAIDPEITNAEQMYNNLYEIQNKINEVLK